MQADESAVPQDDFPDTSWKSSDREDVFKTAFDLPKPRVPDGATKSLYVDLVTKSLHRTFLDFMLMCGEP